MHRAGGAVPTRRLSSDGENVWTSVFGVAGVTWWFDHHQSAFFLLRRIASAIVLAADELMGQGPRYSGGFYDPELCFLHEL